MSNDANFSLRFANFRSLSRDCVRQQLTRLEATYRVSENALINGISPVFRSWSHLLQDCTTKSIYQLIRVSLFKDQQ